MTKAQAIEQTTTTTTSSIMQAVGVALQAKAGTAEAAISTANAGAMADAIIKQLANGQTVKAHETICSTLRDTFQAMDAEQFFAPTAAEITLLSMKDGTIGGEELRKKVSKARKQTAFRLFRNAFARWDKEIHGDKQVYQLESKGYMFVITQAKEEAKKKGFDKWLSDGAKWLPSADLKELVAKRQTFLESLKKAEQEQEEQAMSIRQEVQAMNEKTLRERAVYLLSVTIGDEVTEEQITACMERLQSQA